MSDEELETAVQVERDENDDVSNDTDVTDTDVGDNTEDNGEEVTEQSDATNEEDEVEVQDPSSDQVDEDSNTEGDDATIDNADESEDGQEADAPATQKYKPLMVDGEEIPINDIDELYTMASAGGRVTQKFQELAKHRRTISAIQEAGLTDDDINTFIEAQKGNKDAIAALVKKAGVDPLDIDEDNAEGYTPSQYGMSDTEQEIADIQQSISNDVEYTRTAHVIDEVWDDASRNQVIENPGIIMGLHNDMKSGLYDKVAPEAKKLAIADGMRRPSIDYYMQAGKLVTQSEMLKQEQDPGRIQAESQRAAKRKSAGSGNGNRVAKKAEIDFNQMSDDDAWKLREQIMSRV